MRATSGVKTYVYGTPTLCVSDDRMLGRSVETRLVRDEYFIGDPRAPVAAPPKLPPFHGVYLDLALHIHHLSEQLHDQMDGSDRFSLTRRIYVSTTHRKKEVDSLRVERF
jgi:hypothetical protein